MIYRKLFDWIDGDDACEASEVTIYSAHDPSHDEEQDFIIRRVRSLIETGVTIQSITLTVWPALRRPACQTNPQDTYQMVMSDDHKHSVDAFPQVIDNIYWAGEAIETMIIKVSIKENHWA